MSTRSHPARTPARGLAAAAAIGLLVLVAGCAGKRQLSAEETFEDANEHFESGAYDLAIEEYKELLDQHPFTEHAEEAEIKIAQAYYSMGRYAEAIGAFADFERMHPTSPEVPMVNYYIGMSHLKQMRPIDRDQSASDRAHAYFRAVIDRYPGSPWAERATLRLRECEEALAAHELYVAQFYLKNRNLPAAEARLGRILQSYVQTDAAAHGLMLFGDTYARRGLDRPAALAYRALVTYHPDEPAADEAASKLARLPALDPPKTGTDADPVQELIQERPEMQVASEVDPRGDEAPGPSFVSSPEDPGTDVVEPGSIPPDEVLLPY
jgi:outer membrane protein assembly factor BamD